MGTVPLSPEKGLTLGIPIIRQWAMVEGRIGLGGRVLVSSGSLLRYDRGFRYERIKRMKIEEVTVDYDRGFRYERIERMKIEEGEDR